MISDKGWGFSQFMIFSDKAGRGGKPFSDFWLTTGGGGEPPDDIFCKQPPSTRHCRPPKMPPSESFNMHLNNFQLLESVGPVPRMTNKVFELIQDKPEGLIKKLQLSERLVPNVHQSSY